MADNEERSKRMLDSTGSHADELRTRHGQHEPSAWEDKADARRHQEAAAELPRRSKDSRKAIAAVEASMAAMQRTIDSADRNLKNIWLHQAPGRERENAGLTHRPGKARS